MHTRTMTRWSATLMLVLLAATGCKRTLTVTLEGTGEVMSEDGTIDCKARCETELDKGAELVLSAAAPPGSRFEGWGGSCSGIGPCSVTLEDNVAVSARFSRVASLKVEIEGDGEGTIESDKPCAEGCDLELKEGEVVKLEPKPAEGMEFSGWSGACTGEGTCQLTARGEQKVVATFVIPRGTVLGKGRLEILPGRRVVGMIETSAADAVVVASTGGPAGEAVEIVRADQAGSRMWTKLPKPEVLGDLQAMEKLDDGGFVLVGTAGRADCAFARYRSDNERAWNVALPDCGKVVDVAVTGDPGARVVVALGKVGGYGSGFDFLGTPLRMKGGSDAFIARFDDAGQVVGVSTFGSRTSDEPKHLAVSENGAVTYIALCARKDCRLVALGADGAEMWSQSYPGQALELTDLAVSGPNVYVTGRLDKKKAKGGGLLKGLDLGGAEAGCDGGLGFFARLSATTGQPAESRVLGAKLTHVLPRADDVVVLGAFGPKLAFADEELGDGECEGKDDLEAFVAGLAGEEENGWVRTFEKAPPFPEALAANNEGHALALARGLGVAGAVDEAPPGEASWMRLK